MGWMDWLKKPLGGTLAPEAPRDQDHVALDEPDEDVWLPDEDSLLDELQPGELFGGRYRLLRPLGRGAVGWVLKARDIELDLDVAIKVLRGGLEPELQDTLRGEARVALRLDHPRICRAYHFGRAQGRPYLVLELLHGEDLHQRRRRMPGRRLPVNEVVAAGLDAIAALEHAHGHGIVHNDLKPGNLFRTSHGPIKVCDFGLAGLRAGPLVIGTLAYLDPVRVSAARSGPWSDVYGLGATLFTLGHGEPPHGRGEQALLRAQQGHEASSPHIPDPLLDAIVSCLAMDTAERPTLTELRDSLLTAAARLHLELTDDSLEVTPHTGPVGDIAAELAKLRLPEPDPLTKTPQPPQARRPRKRKRAPGERHLPPADFAVVPACTVSVHDDERDVAAYRIARHPVTNGLYQRFVTDTGHRHPDGWTNRGYAAGREDHPVSGVTYADAVAFAAWAGARLPTTHEWLAALRGPEGRRFPWGDECDAARCACPAVTTVRETRPVRSAPESATPEGVLEMLGNVWEWTADGPEGPTPTEEQHWVAGGSYSHACGQEAGREPVTSVSPVHAYRYLGFRVARDLGGTR